jgi:lysozyme
VDPVTKGEPYTIGYGSTNNVHPNMKITLEEAEEMLVSSLPLYEAVVNKSVYGTVNQNQFDAMVSLCYNIGSRAFQGSSVVRKLNQNDVHGAADAFLMWDKGHTPKGFKVIPGLLKRRQDERKLFMEPI